MSKNTLTPEEQEAAERRAWQRMLRETRIIASSAESKALGINREQPPASTYITAIAQFRMALAAGMRPEAAHPIRLRAEDDYYQAILPEEISAELAKRRLQ